MKEEGEENKERGEKKKKKKKNRCGSPKEMQTSQYALSLSQRCSATRQNPKYSGLATFCGDCIKTHEDVAPNFFENRPGCFNTTTPRLTLPSSPSSFWRNINGCHPPQTVLPRFGIL
jgi:hypothetical protein